MSSFRQHVRDVTSRPVFRDSMSVVVACGAFAVSFGAIAQAAGLSLWQTMVLSLVMFSGGSQFALVGVVAGGGSPWVGATAALLLGSRNTFYGLRLSGLLRVKGWRKAATAQVVIDESAALAMGRDTDRDNRIGFYATGIGIFVLWNLGTLVGVLGAAALSDPSVFGFDALGPAAFLALLAPRLRGRELWAIALGAAVLAVVATPFTPPGVPVLVAAAFGILVGTWPRRSPTAPLDATPAADPVAEPADRDGER